jgi:multidrug resistance efflux pump
VAVIERNAKDRESRLISRLDKAQEDNKALEQMVGLLRDRIEALQTESQHLASQCVIERQRRDMAEERAQQMETETEESIANVKELWQYEAKNAATAFTEVARIRGQANTWRARMFGVLWLTASVIVGVMWITTDRVDVFDVENDEFFA